MPSVEKGSPQILTGQQLLDRPVRWIHICEQPNMTTFVDSDHLVLTSGMGLGDQAPGWIRLFDTLSARRAVGVFLELGVVVDRLPVEAIAHAQKLELVIVVFCSPTRFVEITHGIHDSILNSQLDQLLFNNRVHEEFTELTWNRTDAQEIVEAAAELLNHPVVVEDLAYRVLHFSPGVDNQGLELRNWAARSASLKSSSRINHDEEAKTLSIQLGSQGQIWGRLICFLDTSLLDWHILIADRAAIALDLQRLIDADDLAVELHSKRSLLNRILSKTYSSSATMCSTLEAAGIPAVQRSFVGGSVRIQTADSVPLSATDGALQRENLRIVHDSLRQTSTPGLVADQSNGQISVMLSLNESSEDNSTLTPFSKALQSQAKYVGKIAKIAFGQTVSNIDDVRQSCEEANHVLSAAADDGQLFHRLNDTRIRGLLRLLDSDPRLQSFTSRQLGQLTKQADSQELVRTLTGYLDIGRNKTAAARQLGISRPTLYDRLDRISRLLNSDLDDPHVALSLQFALYARASMLSEPN